MNWLGFTSLALSILPESLARFFFPRFFAIILLVVAVVFLNFRTAPLPLKRTWLDCLSRNSIFFWHSKNNVLLTVWCVCVCLCGLVALLAHKIMCLCLQKSSKFDGEINFRNFRQLFVTIYRPRFVSVWPELSNVHEEK